MNKEIVAEWVIVFFCYFALISCEQPSDSFHRTNIKDPESVNFVPTEASGLIYEISDGTLFLSWNDESNFEDGYVVEKAINDTLNFEEIAILSPDSQQFEDSDIGYFNISYRISPFVNRDGERNKTDPKPLLLNRYQPPSLWYNLSTEKKTEIHLIHDPPSDVSVEGYELERWETTSFIPREEREYEMVSRITELPSHTRDYLYIDTTLVRNGHTYDFRIRAYYEDDKSFYTDTHCCYSTRGFRVARPTILPPEQNSTSSMFLNWKFNDNKAEGAVVERSVETQEAYNVLATFYTTETSYLDRNMDPDKPYYYRISTLGSEYTNPAKIVYSTGLSESKRFPSGGKTELVATRPGTDEFATTYLAGTFSNEPNKIKLWRTNDDSPYEEIPVNQSLRDLEFNDSGEYLIIGSGNDISIYTLADNSTSTYLTGKEDAKITSISVQPGSHTVAVGYDDGVIQIIEFSSFGGDSATVHTILHDLNSATDMQYSSDGKVLAASDQNGTLILYEASENYRVRSQIQGHTDQIRQLAISHDNRLIATCSGEDAIRLWDMDDLSRLGSFYYSEFRSPYFIPIAVEFSKNDDFLFVSTTQKTLLVWDIRREKLHQILFSRTDDKTETVHDLALNEEGTHLYSAVYFETIRWELKEQWIKSEN